MPIGDVCMLLCPHLQVLMPSLVPRNSCWPRDAEIHRWDEVLSTFLARLWSCGSGERGTGWSRGCGQGVWFFNPSLPPC